jgi:hypothetical protein
VTAGGQTSGLGKIVTNPTRFLLTCLVVGGNIELWHLFKKAWWSGEKAPHFFFRSDWDKDFRDQDKFGHLLGGYQKRALTAAVAYAALFPLQIEIFDGMYNKYGFSYADVHALLPTRMQSYWPSVLRASIGHSSTDYIDPVTGASQPARRKLLLSIDIDPEKLPGENPLWKGAKHQLGYHHFASPALQLTPSLRGIS